MRQSLVLLGGGHSHVEVLREAGQRLPKAPQPAIPAPATPTAGPSNSSVNLTVVSRGRFTPYSGMLPGWASGFYSFADCHIDLQRLAEYTGARLVTAEATGLDVQGRRVLFDDGRPPLPYDVLSIDVGITPGSSTVPGADLYSTPVKPIDGFVRRYEQLVERFRASLVTRGSTSAPGEQSGPQHQKQRGPAGGEALGGGTDPRVMLVCVVGGGAGGVELAGAVRHRLAEEQRRVAAAGGSGGGDAFKVFLVCRGGLLPGHPPHVRRLVRRLLAERGVELRERDGVVGVTQGALHLERGAQLPFDECLWCTDASPAPWLRETGLPTDPQGFLRVTDKLQSDGGPQEVFAAGDVASCTPYPRPKAGVYAVRQGPPLSANLRAFMAGQPLQPFKPQENALALISLGNRFCVASRTGVASVSPAGRAKAATVTAGSETGRGSETVPGAGAGAATRMDVQGAHAKVQAAAAKEPNGNGNGDADGNGDGEDGPEWALGWLLNGCGGRLVGLTGSLLWRWKDSIDRAFMRRYGEALDLTQDLQRES